MHGTHPRYTQCLIFHIIMICKDMNCMNPRFQMISCIGLEMVKTYFKLFSGKIHSKCLSYTGECHIYIVAPLKYNTIIHDTIKYNTIQHNIKLYNMKQYHTIQYKIIQYNAILFNTIQYHTIPYNSIRYNTMQYYSIQYNTNPYNSIRYNTIQ